MYIDNPRVIWLENKTTTNRKNKPERLYKKKQEKENEQKINKHKSNTGDNAVFFIFFVFSADSFLWVRIFGEYVFDSSLFFS